MATKGIKIKDNSNNVLLPVTSSDLVEVNYGGQTKILTALLEENEQVTAEALIDLNNRIDTALENISTAHLQYGICGTAASTAAKTVTINDFSLVDGAMFTVKFSNTNNANTAPTLNLNETGAKPMYRRLNNSLIRVVGAFLMKDYYYTFLYDLTNDRYIIIDSTFGTDDVIEVVCTRDGDAARQIEGIVAGAYAINEDGELVLVQQYNGENNALLFSKIPPTKNIKKYVIIVSFPTSTMGENYIKLVLGITSGTLAAATNYAAVHSGNVGSTTVVYWDTARAFVCNYQMKNDYTKGYIEYFDTTDNYEKYIEFVLEDLSGHPMVAWAVSGKLGPKNINNVLAGDIVLNKRNKVIGSLNADESSTIDLAEPGNFLGSTSAPYVPKCTSAPGVVDSCAPHANSRTALFSMNTTDANVTIDYYDSNLRLTDNKVSASYSFMRYETPLVYYTNIATTCSSSTKYRRYYSTTYNGYIGTPLHTAGQNTAYAYAIIGNNYYDITNFPNGEMFFYNGSTLRNYITAYCVPGNLGRKVLNSNTEIQFGNTDTSGNLKMSKNQLTFDGSLGGWDCTPKLEVEKITTPALDFRVAAGNQQYGFIDETGFQLSTNIYANHFYENSDKRIKSDITPITNSEFINIYSFKKNNENRTSYGFIAQEVQVTHPELVTMSYVDSYLKVDYNSTLSYLLATALNKIDELTLRVNELEEQLKNK